MTAWDFLGSAEPSPFMVDVSLLTSAGWTRLFRARYKLRGHFGLRGRISMDLHLYNSGFSIIKRTGKDSIEQIQSPSA
jgi:hypothetical protein